MKKKFGKPEDRIKRYEKKPEEEAQLGKERAARFTGNKLRYDLLPPTAISEIVAIYTYGAQKYDPNNWWKGMPWSDVIAPLERHIAKWKRGEIFDEESGLHHLAHVAWNAIALYEYQRCGLGTDDRRPEILDLEQNDETKDGSKNEQ